MHKTIELEASSDLRTAMEFVTEDDPLARDLLSISFFTAHYLLENIQTLLEKINYLKTVSFHFSKILNALPKSADEEIDPKKLEEESHALFLSLRKREIKFYEIQSGSHALLTLVYEKLIHHQQEAIRIIEVLLTQMSSLEPSAINDFLADHKTLLYKVVESGDVEMIALLLRYKADPNIDGRERNTWSLINHFDPDNCYKEEEYRTTLYAAHTASLEALLASSVNSAPWPKGLIWMLVRAVKVGNEASVRLLLEYVNKDESVCIDIYKGRMSYRLMVPWYVPVMYQALNYHEWDPCHRIMRLLKEAGADFNVKGGDYENLLDAFFSKLERGLINQDHEKSLLCFLLENGARTKNRKQIFQLVDFLSRGDFVESEKSQNQIALMLIEKIRLNLIEATSTQQTQICDILFNFISLKQKKETGSHLMFEWLLQKLKAISADHPYVERLCILLKEGMQSASSSVAASIGPANSAFFTTPQSKSADSSIGQASSCNA